MIRSRAPSCGSCHGSLDNKAGSPWLEQQPEPYILSQLQGFASGDRHNDIGQQMRNIARQMTSDEMAEAARYYASEPLGSSTQGAREARFETSPCFIEADQWLN
jgi:cytochrome c553